MSLRGVLDFPGTARQGRCAEAAFSCQEIAHRMICLANHAVSKCRRKEQVPTSQRHNKKTPDLNQEFSAFCFSLSELSFHAKDTA